MHNKYFSLLDMAIVAVPVMTIGIWQLVSVSREIGRDKANKEATTNAPADPPSPESARHPVGEHGLDDR